MVVMNRCWRVGDFCQAWFEACFWRHKSKSLALHELAGELDATSRVTGRQKYGNQARRRTQRHQNRAHGRPAEAAKRTSSLQRWGVVAPYRTSWPIFKEEKPTNIQSDRF
jgi:hypothetical protein